MNCNYHAGQLPLCSKTLLIPFGVANEAVVINITGRTNRVYRFMENTDENGMIWFDIKKLPVGFFSVHTPVYKIWFEDLMGNAETVTIEGESYRMIEFSFGEIISDFEVEEVHLWSI